MHKVELMNSLVEPRLGLSTLSLHPSPRLLQRKCACGGHPDASGECEQCRRKRLGNGRMAAVVPPIVHAVLQEPGRPLTAEIQADMESRFGHALGGVQARDVSPRMATSSLEIGPKQDAFEREADRAADQVTRLSDARSRKPALAPGFDFSRVRIHTGAQAARSAQAVQALAYTVGRDVVFGAGAYAPGTPAGRRILAHELTHVAQQAGASGDRAGNGQLPQRLMRVPTEDNIENDEAAFSTNCGWIDWNHAQPFLMAGLIEEVRQASARLASSPQDDHETVTGPRMESRGAGVLFSGVTPVANIHRPLNDEEVLSVALRIFMAQSIAFEDLQSWTDWLKSSSFSEEDLPSNLIGFYRAARGYSRSDIETFCDTWSADASLAMFDGYTFKQNREFTPVVPGTWPAELSDIQPAAPHGALMDMVKLTLEVPPLIAAPRHIRLLDRDLIDDPDLHIEPVGVSNPIDISSDVSSPEAGPHFEVGPLRPGHTLQFRWGIRDEQDRAYAMWSEGGQVHQYGSQTRAYIGSGTRALLRERGITNAVIRCRVKAGNRERLLTFEAAFTW